MPIEAPIDLAGWRTLAGALSFETGLLIDGQVVPAQSGESFAVINPANGKLLAEPACGAAADIDRAVGSARAAWEDGRWRHMAPRLRMDVFRGWADLVDAHRAELALLETLCMGKPITDALTIDLPETVVTIRYFGESIDKVAGAVSNSPHNAGHMFRANRWAWSARFRHGIIRC